MELEKQVCSLELAKRLKELGFEQKSLFWWALNQDSNWEICPLVKGYVEFRDGSSVKELWVQENDFFVSAYTVAELGEMFRPQEIVGSATFITKVGHWRCIPPVQLQHHPHQDADTEANARAKMLIYLKENNLL